MDVRLGDHWYPLPPQNPQSSVTRPPMQMAQSEEPLPPQEEQNREPLPLQTLQERLPPMQEEQSLPL